MLVALETAENVGSSDVTIRLARSHLEDQELVLEGDITVHRQQEKLVGALSALRVDLVELQRAKRVAKEEVFVLLKTMEKSAAATLRTEASATYADF